MPVALTESRLIALRWWPFPPPEAARKRTCNRPEGR